MGVEPEFGTINEADSAYYGSSDDGGNGGSGNWGDLQSGTALDGGWTLAYQEHSTDDKRRWFVIRDQDGLQAINSQGNVYNVKSNDTYADMPHYSLRDDAVAAYNKWAESNPGGDPVDDPGDGGGGSWNKWQKVRQVDPWWIWTRTHSTKDKAQFAVASTRDGEAVYLHPDGSIKTSMHVYSTVDDVTAALEAYFADPPDNPPSGDSPTRETITRDSSEVYTSEKASKMVEKLGGKKAMVAAMGVAGLAVLSQSRGNN
jgi:hypothetical protein